MQKLLFAIPIALLMLSAQDGKAELVSKTVTLTGFYNYQIGLVECATSIDFSSQSLTDCGSAAGDVEYYQRESDGRLIFHGPVQPSATLYDGATTAPVTGYKPDNILDANKTYFVKTADGLYARMIVRFIHDDCECLDIDYVVQTDGTPKVGVALAVDPATWGKIKALYR